MSSFQGSHQDLDDAVAYELSAIEYLRSTLYGHDEDPVGSVQVTLGKVTPDGTLCRTIGVVGRADISGTAVRAALGRFRPLAFSASFKLQDMIVEWILRANGATDWRFSRKLAAYDRLVQNGTLTTPALLASSSPVSKAFWELYRFLVPYRGTVVHSGGVTLQTDGTVSISKGATTLTLTPSQQASYMRSMCVIAKILSARLSTNAFLEALIESDLSDLALHHKQLGLQPTYARLASLQVHVPPAQVRSDPLAFDVDFDQLRNTMDASFTIGTGARVFFSASILAVVGAQQFRWEVPFECIPSGSATIQHGDAQWDSFLTISATSP
jgi:hypothetical protein